MCPRLVPPTWSYGVFAPLWRAAPDDAARLRVVVDQVASLTDPAAAEWHRRLISRAGRPEVS